MNTAIICFSLTGERTGERLRAGLLGKGVQAKLYKKSKYLSDSFSISLKEWTKEQFEKMDAIIFISATGIAVRSIAPYVASKTTDPAVLVIDECGSFVISLLSGHLGGANDLAQEAAKILSAVPVVTTATDLHNRFAVDQFAKKNNCSIKNMKAAKEMSAAILADKMTGFYSEFPYEGKLPKGVVRCSQTGEALDYPGVFPKVGAAVTIYKNKKPFPETVTLIPSIVVMGIGCRKGKDSESIYMAAQKSLQNHEIYQEAIEAAASIDLKKEEPGILSLCNQWKIPFYTFTDKELLQVPGEFTASSFVRQTTGVDNVCERSCVLASNNGTLIQHKIGENGVTIAIALRKWRIHFE